MSFRCLCLLLFLSKIALAQTSEPTSKPASAPTSEAAPEPTTTLYTGVHLLRLDALDLKAGTANVTYYVWTRWRGERDGTAYELMNGTTESRDHEFISNEGGLRYSYYRYRATVQINFNFKDFPFDEQEISLEIEHANHDINGIQFAVDTEGMKHLQSPSVSGWVTEPPRYEIRKTTYHTNWGILDVPADEPAEFSQFRASFIIKHEPAATFAKTFLPLFISTLISFLAFLLHVESIDARIGVGVAGTFGAVTSYAVVAGNLPEIPYLTLADKIHILSLLFIFLVLLESVLLGYLIRSERVEHARRINRWLGISATLVYVGLVLAMLLA